MLTLKYRLLLVLVCAPVLAAPLAKAEDYWWHNACSTPVKTRHLRHAKSPQETAIKRVLNTYKSEVRPYLDSLVAGQHYNQSHIDIPWLPKHPNLRNKKVLHKQLSKYAATLYMLIKMNVSSQDGGYNLTRRLIALEKSKDELKGLICEVEHNFNVTTEKRSWSRSPLPNYTPKDLKVNVPLQADSTATMLEDYSLLTLFGDFIKSYEAKLKQREKRKRRRRRRQKQGIEEEKPRRKNRRRKHRRKKVLTLKQ